MWPTGCSTSARRAVTAYCHGDHMTTARGRVYCEIEGSGSPVVIVPGGPRAGHAHYHPWFSRLADRHTVAYFGQLGTGASERLPDGHGYSVELYADTVRQVIAYAGHGRAHVIGVSFGGVAAAELAAVRPELGPSARSWWPRWSWWTPRWTRRGGRRATSTT
jgi:proline iminopeptidase